MLNLVQKVQEVVHIQTVQASSQQVRIVIRMTTWNPLPMASGRRATPMIPLTAVASLAPSQTILSRLGSVCQCHLSTHATLKHLSFRIGQNDMTWHDMTSLKPDSSQPLWVVEVAGTGGTLDLDFLQQHIALLSSELRWIKWHKFVCFFTDIKDMVIRCNMYIYR